MESHLCQLDDGPDCRALPVDNLSFKGGVEGWPRFKSEQHAMITKNSICHLNVF